MKRAWVLLVLFSLGCLQGIALAAPAPPVIALNTSGLNATASWDAISDAVGYTLYYAAYPYAGEESIGQIEVGHDTRFSAELWTGAAFYVAVKSYDSQGQFSNYSNIELFSIEPPLRAATSAAELEAFLKRGLTQQTADAASYRYLATADTTVEIAGVPGFSADVGGRSSSGTNLQVGGVDEADRVKSDGESLFIIEQDYLYNLTEQADRGIRVMSIKTEPPGATEIARIRLDNLLPLEGLYLVKDDQPAARDLLVALGTSQDNFYVCALDWFVPWSWQERKTEVNLIDVTTPAAPQVAKNYLFDGQLVSSRRIGSKLYLVLRYNPSLPDYILYPQAEQEQVRNKELLENATLADLLPTYQVDGTNRGTLASVDLSYLPHINPESVTADVITLVTLDLAAPDSAPVAVTLVGPTETLYMSTSALYLATTSYNYQPVTLDGAMVSYASTMTTDIHKFLLTATGPEYRGSGTVAGHLGWDQDKKSFRMGEAGAALGVVTSVGEDWGGTATTKLTLLGESPTTTGALTEVAHLPNERRPEAIGKPGERLYSARFLGDRLYLVTFRVTDPLYIVDLVNPEDPLIAGELGIDGYSDYLHPVGETLLLGIGKDAIPDVSAPAEGRGAWYQGLKLSLFDVSDIRAPREIDSIVIGKRGTNSEVLTDHHALAYLQHGPGSARLAIPVELHETASNPYDTAAPWYYYDWTHTGLYLFDLNGIDTATPDLSLSGRLIIDSEVASSYSRGERAVIVDGSVHYLHGNNVWSAPWANPEHAVGPPLSSH